MDTCICMAKPVCCSPESIKALLIGYAPIQNKKYFLKKTPSSSKWIKQSVRKIDGNIFADDLHEFQ